MLTVRLLPALLLLLAPVLAHAAPVSTTGTDYATALPKPSFALLVGVAGLALRRRPSCTRLH